MKTKKLGKKNIILLIITIVLFLLVSGTIAFYGWSSTRADQNKEIDVALSSGTGICEKISDNNKDLFPTAHKENGRVVTIRANQTMADNAYITWDLDINNIDEGLNHASYKYELIDSTTGSLYGSGSFETAENNSTIVLNNIETLDKNTDYIFTLYLWIDGTIGDNPLTMTNQDYDFDLTCNITGADKPVVTAINKITNLYNNASKTPKTQTGSNMTYNYAELYKDEDYSGGLMNDRLGSMDTNIDGGNIRYYGANPKNYIYFNCEDYSDTSTCELWRIIGVVDGRLKLIRNESIGNYSWDSSASSVNGNGGFGINQWGESSSYTGADLMKLLNPGYEDNKGDGINTLINNSLYWNRSSGKCFNNCRNSYTNCDFTSSGITTATKDNNLIADATWYLGAIDTNNIYANEAYTSERGTNVVVPGTTCSGAYCNDTITRTTSWTGKGALMYLSDYGYAADLTKCGMLSAYNSTTNSYECRKNDWLYYSNSFQWTITARLADARSVWSVYRDGNAGNDSAGYSGAVRPVYYLNSNAILASGNGSQSNPYQLLVG